MTTTLVPEDILRKIRTLAQEARSMKNPKSFRPPEVDDFEKHERVLCFDQTLNNCGWALLNVGHDYAAVWKSGTIRPPQIGREAKGFEATFTKSVFLARDIRSLLRERAGEFDRVVLELPSVLGYRTESSLVAAATICVTLDEMGETFPSFVSRQSAGATLCGDRGASKNLSSEVVNRLVGDRPTGTGQWTEHVRDAVFVGLRNLYLEDS